MTFRAYEPYTRSGIPSKTLLAVKHHKYRLYIYILLDGPIDRGQKICSKKVEKVLMKEVDTCLIYDKGLIFSLQQGWFAPDS